MYIIIYEKRRGYKPLLCIILVKLSSNSSYNLSFLPSGFKGPEFIQHKIQRNGDNKIDPGSQPFRNAQNADQKYKRRASDKEATAVSQICPQQLLSPGIL